MRHIWEFHTANFIFSEPFSQKFHQLAAWFDVRWVVLGGQEESGASNLAGKFGLAASEKSLESQRGVWACDGDERIIFLWHFECPPHSPAKTNSEILLNSPALQIGINLLEFLCHDGLVLPLDVLHNIPASRIGIDQNFGKVDIVIERCEQISDVSVSAACGSEDVGDDEQRVLSLAHVIEGDAVNGELLALGLVFWLELRPWALRTATHNKNVSYRACLITHIFNIRE